VSLLLGYTGLWAAQGPEGIGGALMPMLTLFAPLLLVFYLLVMLPQRKEQSKRATMLANLKKNDRVVTVGGIYGVVANVHREADEVTLKVDESTNTKLRVTMGSISRVLSGDESSDANKQSSDTK
jgi:preprotein translocase subunit YajC